MAGGGERICERLRFLPFADAMGVSILRLEFESGAIIDSPSEADLLRIEGEEFAILSGDSASTYIQCADQNEPPWEYILEYQNGSLDEHYCAVDGPITLERAIAAFRKYLNGDASWMTDFEWERMDVS